MPLRLLLGTTTLELRRLLLTLGGIIRRGEADIIIKIVILLVLQHLLECVLVGVQVLWHCVCHVVGDEGGLLVYVQI